MTTLDDLAVFPPDDCRHPRHRGLRTVGCLAALEVTAVAGVFGAWALIDAALTRAAAARGVVRHTLRTASRGDH